MLCFVWLFSNQFLHLIIYLRFGMELILAICFTGQQKLDSDSEGSDGGLYISFFLSPNLK